jgi:uncharacterized protein (TIGR00255 family)
MLRSMTGFGAASREGGELTLRVEARSVNHRHLLVKSRLTSDFAYLEGEVEGLAKKRLARGSVSITVSHDRSGTARVPTLNHAVAKRLHDDIVALAGELGISADVSMDALLGLPGVVGAADDGRTDPKSERKLTLGAIDEALTRLVEMREVEGSAIAADLKKHASATVKLVSKIARRMPTVVRAHQKNLEKRMQELLGSSHTVHGSDVAREAALLADRLDIAEEVARLTSHLDQLDLLVDNGGRVGRKLDFLVQEIFREINTIGSKCSDAKVAHWVVDAKTHVERLREQVQNVE